jgi:hypothetical protein
MTTTIATIQQLNMTIESERLALLTLSDHIIDDTRGYINTSVTSLLDMLWLRNHSSQVSNPISFTCLPFQHAHLPAATNTAIFFHWI